MRAGAAQWLGRFVNGEAVYGTILTAGVVAGLSHFIDDASELLLTSIGTVIVFWIAHAFAEIVGDRSPDVRRAVKGAVTRSTGMLWGLVPLTVILCLAMTGVMSLDVSVNVEIGVSIVLLTVLGFFAAVPKTDRLWIRLLCGAGAGALGAVMIVLKEFVH
ncbi:hypothetical protein ACIBIZ_10335 [Nonomuraea spiralis]|uniref:Integral membrane protein n=1 Tax=Nonomuraea spiralis TaxID=46182 RepID=A0ABV5IHP5_9ACTN|nr:MULTISPECIES: hypothetical protein [Nonomuraea]RSN09471.1 hypothetical protein DMB42_19445 [Nonomuraea sp. WAC 01424]GGS99466.1 hypothetical protein GCM10010176_049310 [Nonomuraea spiralis]